MVITSSATMDSISQEVDETATSLEALNLNEPKLGFDTDNKHEHDKFDDQLIKKAQALSNNDDDDHDGNKDDYDYPEVDETASSLKGLNLNEPKLGLDTDNKHEHDKFETASSLRGLYLNEPKLGFDTDNKHEHDKFDDQLIKKALSNNNDDNDGDDEDEDDEDDYDYPEESTEIGAFYITNLGDIVEESDGLKRKFSEDDDDDYLYSRTAKRSRTSFVTFLPVVIGTGMSSLQGDSTTELDEVSAAVLSMFSDWVSETLFGLTPKEPEESLPDIDNLKITSGDE